MRIGYEGFIYQLLPFGGIARYFNEVISRFEQEYHPCILLAEGTEVPSLHPNQTTLTSEIEFPLPGALTEKLLGRYWRCSQWSKLDRQLEQMNADIHHWTFHCGLCQRPLQRMNAPIVVTVYDLIYEKFPELDKKGKHRRWLKQSIEIADQLLCISETTFDDLCNRYPGVEQKTRITKLGNSFSAVSDTGVPPELKDRPYILFVGQRRGYKNFGAIWSAWKQIKSVHPDLLLVAAGPPLSEREANTLGIDKQEPGFLTLSHVADSTLKSLYKNSIAFVFPSQMEGFGLPAVEAMESGCIVLASNCDALREICGGAAYHFDPLDFRHLAELIEMAIKMPKTEHSRLIQKGKQRASEFTWDSTAAQTMRCYQDLKS